VNSSAQILAERSFYRGFAKRWCDLISAAILLVVFALPICILALLIRIRLGSPIFFRQERIGFNEKRFYLIKFRTMTDTRDENGHLLPDSQRLTAFGKFLRASSLDELPELLNVLRGEMSLVGPRPLLTRYLPFYRPDERCRHSVRPGLTGLAQVRGRNFLRWDQRFAMDVRYVRELSFWLDLKILFLTVCKVVRRSGVAELPTTVMQDLDQERQPQPHS
jgi:lipopolysaccharide/colanic/teichoic acid biosynthesis glycosyltransferase